MSRRSNSAGGAGSKGEHFLWPLVIDGVLDSTSSSSAADLLRRVGESLKMDGRSLTAIAKLELPRVRKIDLSNNALTRVAGLADCPKTTLLKVVENQLTGKRLGEAIASMPELATLNAGKNSIKALPGKALAGLHVLKALVVNDNKIASLPACLGSLQLNTLVLSHNSLSGSLPAAHFSVSLLRLSMSHNELAELPDLSHCTSLQQLRAAHNAIDAFPQRLPASLRLLDLASNAITESSWPALEAALHTELPALGNLALKGNPIVGSSRSGTAADESNDGEAKKLAAEQRIRAALAGSAGRKLVLDGAALFGTNGTNGTGGTGGTGSTAGKQRGTNMDSKSSAREAAKLARKLCFKCQQPGHWMRDCPLLVGKKKPRKRERLADTAAAAAPPPPAPPPPAAPNQAETPSRAKASATASADSTPKKIKKAKKEKTEKKKRRAEGGGESVTAAEGMPATAEAATETKPAKRLKKAEDDAEDGQSVRSGVVAVEVAKKKKKKKKQKKNQSGTAEAIPEKEAFDVAKLADSTAFSSGWD
eukprot:g6172.t1